MRSNPGQPPRQDPPLFNKYLLPPPPSTPLETPVFTISSRPAEPVPNQSRKIQPASFYPPPDLEKATYIPKVYSILYRENGFSALGPELRYVWELNRFRWYNDEHDDYFGPPKASDRSPKPYAVSVDPRLYSSETAEKSINFVMHLSSRNGPVPHCLNFQLARPTFWPLKPAGKIFTLEHPQSGIDGNYASPCQFLYAPRSAMYHAGTTAPSISFLMHSGLPPLIHSLANNEQTRIICHHDDPLFTLGPRKGTMMILHQLPNLGTITQEIAKYHRDGRSLTREELAKHVSQCLWDQYIGFQKEAGYCKERKANEPYIPPARIPVGCDPWSLQYVRPRMIRLMGLNCYGDEWVSVFATELPSR